MKEQSFNKSKLMKLVLTISILLFIVKFLSYFLTRSDSILTDAVESIVNIVTGAFALYSIYYAAKPKDLDHPYGHGKIEFLSSGLEGSMILIAGIGMVFKGIFSFFSESELQNIDWGIYLTLATGTVNFILGTVLVRQGKRQNSVTLVAEGKHLLSDTYSSLAIIIGLTLIFLTNIIWIDYVVAIIVGLLIAYSGIRLVRESIDNLLDKADVESVNEIVKHLELHKKNKWIDIHNLRVLKYGDHLHIDCHVTLPWYESLSDTHDEVDAVKVLMREKMHDKMEFFIHADPCVPPVSCGICPLKDCNHRKQEFKQRVVWSADNMLPDKKHGF